MPPKTANKKKLAANDNHRKINTYFKPTPKEPIKRKLETNENSELHEESHKRTPSPPNTKPMESKKGLSIQNRPVLRDINPAQSLNPEAKSDTHSIRPTFAVLSDADIERGLEKATTPPISIYCDEKPIFVYRDSQESDKTRNTHKQALNTQTIPDSESQWTEDTHSPLHVFEDEEPFEISASQVQEKADYEKYGSRKRKTDENAAEQRPEEDEDSNFEDSDLFTKTVDTTVRFRPTSVEQDKSEDEEDDLFFSSALQPNIGGSTFFDDEKDDTYIDHHEFSVASDYADPELEFSIGEDEQPTLSPEVVEAVSQVHVPYPNPRGKDILEKLDLSPSSSSSVDDELPT
ncbi:hypothetical protein A0J61_07564 [Choanephora cucurbitarum]|uniref:Uncharacterized protein n=1 Tax=Choanephora cucurbitarum TaxID=101091 RepID=A0A1C7N715_9FUNG|nr:hypothetical protein A0J61_07564 [Choanephora cucurbitarum]